MSTFCQPGSNHRKCQGWGEVIKKAKILLMKFVNDPYTIVNTAAKCDCLLRLYELKRYFIKVHIF